MISIFYLLAADYPIRPTYLVTIVIALLFGIVAFVVYLRKKRRKDDKVG